MNRLHGLRHYAVIGGDDQNHDVGHLGAPRPHCCKRGVAGRIDEGDLCAGGRGYLIGAYMLGDAASFARRYFRGTNGIKERSLAMIDVAHDRDDWRAGLELRGIVRDVEQSLFYVGFGHAADCMTHFLGDELRRVGVDDIVDRSHLALFHQQPDDIDGTFGHPVGEILNRDRLRDRNFAKQLFLWFGAGLTLKALDSTAEGGNRTLTHVILTERVDHGQTAPLFLAASAWSGPRCSRSGGATTP
jgi:hypothetical protein